MRPAIAVSVLPETSTSGAFRDRRQAGRALAAAIGAQIPELAARPRLPREREEPPAPAPAIVLGLPRGGVPVAYEVARALELPMDVLLARKIGAPGNPELGIGAVAEGGVEVLSNSVLSSLLISQEELELGAARAHRELAERVRAYRAGRPPMQLRGRTAIIVDDGLATGGTARAAIQAAREMGARRVVLAVPVGASSTVRALRSLADDLVCVMEPEPLWAIGAWYEDFAQVSDERVRELLARAAEHMRERGRGGAGAGDTGGDDDADLDRPELDGTVPGDSALATQSAAQRPGGGGAPAGAEAGAGAGAGSDADAEAEADAAGGDPVDRSQVTIPFEQGGMALGDLCIPEGACALTLFAHGSGSSRRSPRNRQVAEALRAEGIATLLFDLLTPDEELLRGNIFNIALLAGRLRSATVWAQRQPQLRGLPIGYFGASTGAAAALWAAADLGEQVGAVVSRGGRPDLAGPRLAEVQAPVLLIVGGADTVVMELNRQALGELDCVAQLSIVEGATHLFEEPGALEEVSALAAQWLRGYLAAEPE